MDLGGGCIDYGGDGQLLRPLSFKNGFVMMAACTIKTASREETTTSRTRELMEDAEDELIVRMMYIIFMLGHGPNCKLHPIRAQSCNNQIIRDT